MKNVVALALTAALATPVFSKDYSSNGSGSDTTASGVAAGYSAEHTPSIAVLPFGHAPDGGQQESAAEGIEAGIATDLSRLSGLVVTSPNSTSVYAERQLDVADVGQELGVLYLLEGAIQPSGDRIGVMASLIEVATGDRLWSKQFEGNRNAQFDLQDSIAAMVIKTLDVQLSPAEQKAAAHVETTSVPAYEAFVRGREHLRRETPEDLALAHEYLEHAVALDPEYSRAHAALAVVYYTAFQRGWNRQLRMGWNVARLRSGKHMMEARKRPTALMHRVNSEMMLRVGRTEEALSQAEAAVALDPNDPESKVAAAQAMIFLGLNAEAMEMAEAGMRRDPHFPARYLYLKGLASFGLEDFGAAVDHLEQALERDPGNHRANAILAAALGHLGRIPEAKRNFEIYLDRERDDTSKGRMSEQAVWLRWPYTQEADWLRLAEGLALASGKELPSSVTTAGTMNENSFFEYMLGEK